MDLAAANALGETLRRLAYSEDTVVELLGDDAYDAGVDNRAVFERRLRQGALATTVRLLFLELAVARSDAERALGRRAVDALAALGLAKVDREVAPRARLVPIRDILLASDGFTRGSDDPPDYVATYTPSARRCDFLTPRPRVARALDVGAGGGAQALFAARHSRRVVATDVNPRALGYSAINAALNALANVETRSGSLFDPVAGETYDLITCNAPYVVSPERRWTYRDSGFGADEVSERVVRSAAEHLAPRGLATLAVSWVAYDEHDLDARPREWVDGSGCDAWIIAVERADPLGHAATWNDHLLGDDAYATAVGTWAEELEQLGVRWITEGVVLLHRRDGSRHAVRVDEIDEDDLKAADGQIRRAFAARARLAELGRADELLDEVLAPARALRIEHELAPRAKRRARVRLVEGTRPVVDAQPEIADVFAALDGSTRLRDLVPPGVPPGRVVALARDLLELGALRFR